MHARLQAAAHLCWGLSYQLNQANDTEDLSRLFCALLDQRSLLEPNTAGAGLGVLDSKNKMPLEFKWNKINAFQVNPSKYGYAQVAHSMLKTITFNLEDIKDWAILDSGATSQFLVTDASATGISVHCV